MSLEQADIERIAEAALCLLIWLPCRLGLRSLRRPALSLPAGPLRALRSLRRPALSLPAGPLRALRLAKLIRLSIRIGSTVGGNHEVLNQEHLERVLLRFSLILFVEVVRLALLHANLADSLLVLNEMPNGLKSAGLALG